MEKIIPDGTEVLIFWYNPYQEVKEDDTHFIKGVVLNSNLSEDLSYHGSSWYEQIYTVMGEDGKTYKGVYGNGMSGIGLNYFRTIEDHVHRLDRQIQFNNDKISKIDEENNNLLKIKTALQTNSHIKKRIRRHIGISK